MNQQEKLEKASDPSKNPKWIITPGLEKSVDQFINLCESTEGKPILIVGPTGTGKSLFLHIFEKLYKKNKKNQGEKSIIKIANCAHYSGTDLARSELFGYVPGAFTGASEKGHEGLISKADKGVLILEEIGTLPKNVQAMLLTFIEDGWYSKVGGATRLKAHVQIVGATNSIENVREDFLYRFLPFHVPPIYERREDILFLLYSKYPEIIRELKPWEVLTLLAYNWPGNVREIERAGGLIKQKIEYINSCKTNKSTSQKGTPQDVDELFFQETFAQIKSMYKIPKDYIPENRYAPILKSNLFGFDKEQTGLSATANGELLNKLKMQLSDEVLESLEEHLNEFYVGIYPENSYQVFSDKPKFRSRNDFIGTESVIIDSVIPPKENSNNFLKKDNNLFVNRCNTDDPFAELFRVAYRGLRLFCQLFYKSPFSNKDLFDFNNYDYCYPFASRELLNISGMSILQSAIFQFVSNITLLEKETIPAGITDHQRFLKKLSELRPNNPFLNAVFQKDESTLEEEFTEIADMDYETLALSYYELLLERTGKNKKAAKLAKLPESTFNSRLKKLRIKKVTRDAAPKRQPITGIKKSRSIDNDLSDVKISIDPKVNPLADKNFQKKLMKEAKKKSRK